MNKLSTTILILSLLLFFGIACKLSKTKFTETTAQQDNITPDSTLLLKVDSLKAASFLTDTLLERMKDFHAKIFCANNLQTLLNEENLMPVQDSLILSFYEKPELKAIAEYYNFSHFYYAYGKVIRNEFLPIYVLNTNGQSAISIDLLLIDTNKNLKGFIQVASLELQPSYGISVDGEFISDTIFKQEYNSYEMDEYAEYTQNIVYHYFIEKEGVISMHRISEVLDTSKISQDHF